MTITYSLEVSKARLCGFAKLLIRWRGSIYRLMYREMLIFAAIYYALAICYRHLMPARHQRVFEMLSVYCREFTSLIPITFVMGFYVAMVANRWWQQYVSIPWPDRCCTQVATYIQGMDERGRLIRRALARYLNLMAVLTFTMVSTVIKKRFPTLDHLVEAGILTVEERMALDEIPTTHGIWWVPCTWFCQLAMVARKEGRIHDDLHLKSLIDEALNFRSNCGMMYSYDWISIPLVYTQVVTLSVYCFFLACVFGRQYLYEVPEGFPPSHGVDYYVPFFTFFQFFFYMGWLKVAEEMICPYGEDDDDFELNYVLDRNIQVAYLTVDGLYRKYPKLSRDQFWDMDQPDIPYTAASASYKMEPFIGSTMSMNLNAKGMEWQMDPIAEEKTLRSDENEDDSRLDVESNETRPRGTRTHSFVHSPENNRRPRFLNILLAGDSRPSLAQLGLSSRFGSKSSMASRNSKDSRNGPTSPRSKSPVLGRQMSAPPSRTFRGSEIRMNHNSSIWAEHVEDFVPRSHTYVASSGADQTDKTTELLVNISSPDSTDTVQPDSRTSMSTLVEKIDVPPPLKEEPEPPTEERRSSVLLPETTPLLQHEQTIAEEQEPKTESDDSSSEQPSTTFVLPLRAVEPSTA